MIDVFLFVFLDWDIICLIASKIKCVVELFTKYLLSSFFIWERFMFNSIYAIESKIKNESTFHLSQSEGRSL